MKRSLQSIKSNHISITRINKSLKLVTLLLIFIASSFFLLCLSSTGFMSPIQMINSWNNNYYENGVKLFFVSALVSSIAIAFSSTTLQTINKNNIATPGTLGIGSAGVLGYIFAIYFHIDSNIMRIIIILVFALVPLAINYLIIAFTKIDAKNKTVLVGISITAAIGVAIYILKDQLNMRETSFIFISSFSSQLSWNKFVWILPFLIIGVLGLIILNKHINMIGYSQYIAEKQNINIKLVSFLSSLCILFIVTSYTFLMGASTFLGIIAPNIIKMSFKTSKNFTICLLSTMLNIFIIFTARIIFAYSTLDMNLIITLIAAPIFLMTILRRKNE